MLFSQWGHPGGAACGGNGSEFQFDQAESELSEEHADGGVVGGGGFWSSAWAGERESPSSLLGAERRGPWALGQDLESLPI